VNTALPSKDLIVLVPDRNTTATMAALLRRHQSLEIRQISHEIRSHPNRDPGCRLESQDFLRPFRRQFSYGIVVFDLDGCGCKADATRDQVENEVAAKLASNGWPDRSAAIVIAPELENWLWSESPEVANALGWANQFPSLPQWLQQNGLWHAGELKPREPKTAVERALAHVRKPRSSVIYGDIAKRVSLRHCRDDAFAKLRTVLRQWFPV
jgi:hypothetical protein